MELSESQLTRNNVSCILPITEKYDRLSKYIIYTPKKFITRVVWKTHIPFFRQECLQLYSKYSETKSQDRAEILLYALNNQRMWQRKLDYLSILTVHTTR